jgi:hypothetical protein
MTPWKTPELTGPIPIPTPGPLSDYDYAESLMNTWRQSMGLPPVPMTDTSPAVRSTWAKVAATARQQA